MIRLPRYFTWHPVYHEPDTRAPLDPLDPLAGFHCTCGKHYHYSGWQLGRWRGKLRHLCSRCGQTLTIKGGIVQPRKQTNKRR